MKSHKKLILNILENQRDSISIKQIRGKLGLKKTVTTKLKAELQKLIKAKKITKQGTRYFISHEKMDKALTNVETKQIVQKKFLEKNRSNKKNKHYTEKTVTGYFTRNQKGFGFVNIGFGHSDIFIGKNEQSFAMEGDLVSVHIYKSRGFRGKRKGEIVKILKRASKEILANLKRTKRETIAVPVQPNSGLPYLKIAKKDDITELKSETLIEVEFLEEKNNSKKKSLIPNGRILRALEKTNDLDLGIQLIIKENLIRSKYPEEAKEYVNKISKKVFYNSNSGRRDLRDLFFVTIDGKTARDFDDAVCILHEKKNTESFRLFVAIADVAHYVRPKDPVDKEALLRGTSVYFPTHAVPMLPEELSNNLCSLRPNVNRLTITCEMRINFDGEIEGYSIYESIIRSRARLIYDDVSNFLDGNPSTIGNPILKSNIRIMHKLAKILEFKRIRRGAVQFNFAEEIFELGKDKQIIGVERNYQSSAMKIIEQFMLEANETVAQHCVKNKIPSIYRVHENPDIKKLKKIQKIFHRFGLKTSITKLSDPKNFNLVLKQIQDSPNFQQLQILLLRSMALAIYKTKNKGHFGLAAKFYTHFTSPIRRYPDLLVHRALKEKIYSDQGSKRKKIKFVSSEIAEFCSQHERRAEKAERQSIDLMKVIYLAPYTGQTFQAIITSIENHGFLVNLEPNGIECFLLLESIPDDSYVFDDIHHTLQSRFKKHFLQAGQRIEIMLLSADPIKRNLEFKVKNCLR